MRKRKHQHAWVWTDPTGGDPFMGGPVNIEVCGICGVERSTVAETSRGR